MCSGLENRFLDYACAADLYGTTQWEAYLDTSS